MVGLASIEIDRASGALLIRADPNLTQYQRHYIDAAVKAAEAAVRVDWSPRPDELPAPPVVPVRWTLLSVGEDLRSLFVAFGGGHTAAFAVRESENDIWIAVSLPDPRAHTGRITTLDARSGRDLLSMQRPIAGRKISGPERSPSWEPTRYLGLDPYHPRLRTGERLVPRVIGLNPNDAQRLLHAQGLVPQTGGPLGRQVVEQDPPPDTPVSGGAVVTLVARR